MDPKKILLVSRSFYPMKSPRSFRTTELVKEFKRRGHEVTLLTLKNNEYHVPFEKEHGVSIKDFGPLRFPKVRLSGNSGFLKRISWVLQRVLGLLFEYPDIELLYRVKKALKHQEGYDLLISVAVPHPVHWGVAFARGKGHPIAETWVADCGDPYMGFKMDRFNKPFYFKYPEKMFCLKADYITVPIEGAKKAYYEEFRHKIRVIPQGFNFEEVDIDETKYRSNGQPVFGYAGNLWGGGRNPDELLKTLVNSERDFRFVIYTQNEAPLKPYLDKAEGRIEIRDYIPRKKLLEELSVMDFLVNLENETASQAPSKLIDYYLAGRPVLSVPSSGLNTDKVARFLEGDYTGKYKFEDMDRYRIENVCQKFLALCSSN